MNLETWLKQLRDYSDPNIVICIGMLNIITEIFTFGKIFNKK